MAQAKAKNAQILTTDRGGPLRLALGGVLLAIGLGWAFAMVMSTVSAWNTLRLFREYGQRPGGRVVPAAACVCPGWRGDVVRIRAQAHIPARLFAAAGHVPVPVGHIDAGHQRVQPRQHADELHCQQQ